MSSKDQKMRLKNAVVRYKTTTNKSVPEATKRKLAENPTDSTVFEPKYFQIPMLFHIPRALEQGQKSMYGFLRKFWLWKRFLRFSNPTCSGKKQN